MEVHIISFATMMMLIYRYFHEWPRAKRLTCAIDFQNRYFQYSQLSFLIINDISFIDVE